MEKIGHYRILGTLGQGGMGIVYLARDQALDREVALKVLTAGSGDDSRLLHEARAASRLNHPNVATVYSVEQDAGRVFVVMERVVGGNLAQRIHEGVPSVEEILSVGAQIAAALEAAHGEGIIHRDIKPGNVLLTGDGRVKVTDFGLAETVAPALPDADEDLESSSQTIVSGEKHVAGTVAYMSPEQTRGQPTDARSDLFSLGVLLYEAATGRLPFHESSRLATAAAILRARPRSPRQLRPDLPEALEAIILACLEKRPGDRPRGANDVRSALESVGAGGSVQDVDRILGQPPSRKRRWLAWAVPVVVAAGLAGWWALWPRSDGGGRTFDADFEQGRYYEDREHSRSDLDHAAGFYRQAADAAPADETVRGRLTRVLALRIYLYPDDAGSNDARNRLFLVSADEPAIADDWITRGWIALADGDPAAAAEAGRHARRLAPGEFRSHLLEGAGLAGSGEVDAGLRSLARAVGMDDTEILARCVLGRVLAGAGRTDEAAEQLETVLRYSPDSELARGELRRLRTARPDDSTTD